MEGFKAPTVAPVDYLLHLADNALVLGQRNAEWCGHGPVLEEDIALANISLDLVGQSRMLYQHAASLIGNDFLVFPISSMGSGLGGTGGLALARPLGQWTLGAGLSVRCWGASGIHRRTSGWCGWRRGRSR